mgnify:CR=1 FL=1|tara:strand:+ start:231 stop:1025 length:795 start_codon:yes stop_codon:yes gene_type:complete
MEAIIQNTKEFNTLLSFIGNFDDHVKFQCYEDKIYVQCLAHAHTCILKAEIMSMFFEKYACTLPKDEQGEPQPIVMGIHMKVLNSILKKVKKDEKICMASKDGSQLTLSITDNDSTHLTSYAIKLMDLDSEELQIPKIEDNFRCSLTPSMLKTWNSLILDITKSDIDFKPNKSDNDILTLTSTGECQTVTRQEKVNFDVYDKPLPFTLNQRSVSLVCSMAVFNTEVVMGYQSNMPIGFSMNLEGVQIECFFAPAISDDEEMDQD